MIRRTYLHLLLSVVPICLFISAASANNSEQDRDSRRAVIKPSLVRLKPGWQQEFNVILQAAYHEPACKPKSVKWSVNNIRDGNEKLETIDASGLYRAPKKAPSPPEGPSSRRIQSRLTKRPLRIE